MDPSTRLRAIVAINDTEDVSEDWSWFYDDIRKACEGNGIEVVHAGARDLTIRVGPEGHPLTIDLSEYAAFHKGYLFVERGRPYLFHAYDQSAVVLEAASGYFGLTLRAGST